MNPSIRGVLFDSADVLMRPLGNTTAPPDEAWKEWFPGPRFELLVHAYLPDLGMAGLDLAVERGMVYLDARHAETVGTVAEECRVFDRFYTIVLRHLGASDPPSDLTHELAQARVYDDQMEPFDEVVEVLTRLRDAGLRLGLLSEAWPSLELHYQRLGLRSFFDVFVISSQHGRLKDDPLLFEAARERMALSAGAILFVDDWPPHVQTAIACGFNGVVVTRTDAARHAPELRHVTDLTAVERLVKRHDGGLDP